MYKILLCLRYLRTRYIALACIISVMLGVATMIVVNSVMAGFSSEMRDRIHGLLADVIVETTSLDGVPDAEAQMDQIRDVAGDHIAGMTATVEVYGMLTFPYSGQYITRPVTLIGIRPEGKASVGPLKDYLDSYNELRQHGEVVRAPLRGQNEAPGWELTEAARDYRRQWLSRQQEMLTMFDTETPMPIADAETVPEPVEPPPFAATEPPPFEVETPDGPAVAAKPNDNTTPDIFVAEDTLPDDPFAATSDGATNPFPTEPAKPDTNYDPFAPLDGRLYVGIGLVSFPYDEKGDGHVETVMMVQPGDDVKIGTVSAGRPPEVRHFNATICDVFKSGMSEYDSNLIFCNLEYLQKIRGMVYPTPDSELEIGQTVLIGSVDDQLSGVVKELNASTNMVQVELDPAQRKQGVLTVDRADVQPVVRSITSIQIRLNDFDNADEVVARLKAAFPPGVMTVKTWEQKQGPLLAAVEIESAILNVLLFLIIAVAGFGILAIFFMIVVEKTRDIGILKALGAGSTGVMTIFLSYGLALGIVGSGVGVVIGLLFVDHINTIEDWLTKLTGRKVFDETIYYFPEIPTLVNPMMVVWVALGAMTIAVLASVLPARRASRLRPVEALRYE
ncbi:ABC transporter permease [Thalassoroseus pseudoceratinae]|uniref:ABC transporter permease n=1 Tax=Thalassoroseus pseudoceratinae TaxID=2713176 RepID=UPI001F0ECBD5|nr:FtsX-like permease family protein [Thalassoroseus pseudoceratinae]